MKLNPPIIGDQPKCPFKDTASATTIVFFRKCPHRYSYTRNTHIHTQVDAAILVRTLLLHVEIMFAHVLHMYNSYYILLILYGGRWLVSNCCSKGSQEYHGSQLVVHVPAALHRSPQITLKGSNRPGNVGVVGGRILTGVRGNINFSPAPSHFNFPHSRLWGRGSTAHPQAQGCFTGCGKWRPPLKFNWPDAELM